MAEKKKRTFIKIMSPVGKAVYCHINKPDAKWKPEKPEYKLTLLIPEGPEAEAFEAKIIEAAKRAAEKDGTKLKKNFSVPVKRFEDDEEEKRKPEFEGFVRFTFKSPKKPLQVDSRKNPLPANIFVATGDVVRCSLSVSAWASPLGSGASVYLNGVQLIEKNSTGGSRDDFDEYEGGYVAEATEDSAEDEDDDL